MSTHRLISRAAALAATVSITGLLAAGTASAHVTAIIYGEPAEQGGYTAIVFRVPNEDPEAGTVKVEVSVDPQYALGSARTKPVPGWAAEVTKTKLDEPVQNARGAELDEVVTTITWTAESGTQIAAEQYEEFAISAGPLPTGVDTLVLPTAQFYEGGKVVRWDAPPPAEGTEEPEHPAPVVELAPASEDGHGAAGPVTETTQAEASEASVDTTARWLGGIGLAVGALGLGVGAGATLRARKALSGTKDSA
ncbi:MAG: YcnI family protein [Pseudonocardiaceae bacterium]